LKLGRENDGLSRFSSTEFYSQSYEALKASRNAGQQKSMAFQTLEFMAKCKIFRTMRLGEVKKKKKRKKITN